MYLTVNGLVLRIVNYNDKDALLTVLTQSHGMLTVKARGLHRKNSPLAATCQLLAYNEFTLFESRGFYVINEAQSISLFHELRCDMNKLALATYFAQAAEIISQEDIPNSELLSLVLNCLHALSTQTVPELLVKAVFELRLACIAGYTPDLGRCVYCQNPNPDRFDLFEGHLACKSCRNDVGTSIRMPINTGALQAMRYICTCDRKKLFSFQIGDDSLVSLSQITEGYLCTQLERGFSALDFYKKLLI